MLTSNPFNELPAYFPIVAMQVFVVLMAVLVVVGTVIDIVHKKSARYFFEAAERARETRTREVRGAESASVAVKTIVEDVLASGEFCNVRRRLAHLLTMYGLVLFVVTTVVMVFVYPAARPDTPRFVPLLWHLGALMACIGGYWFWFGIRVDVAVEGNPWYRVSRADLFILSLLRSRRSGCTQAPLSDPHVRFFQRPDPP